MKNPLALTRGALLAALLSACAGQPVTWQPPSDHPASAAAMEAPAPQPSSTLALAGDHDARNGAPTAQPDADTDHAHHQHNGDDDMMHDGAGGDDDGAADAPAMSPEPYLCPMHPEVGSNDPAARCPKCGMKLVPRDELEDQ